MRRSDRHRNEKKLQIYLLLVAGLILLSIGVACFYGRQETQLNYDNSGDPALCSHIPSRTAAGTGDKGMF